MRIGQVLVFFATLLFFGAMTFLKERW